MACQLYRNNNKIEKVLAPNQKPSNLYRDILAEVKNKGVKTFINSIPYLRERLADKTILNESPEEIAVGIWSIAYTSEYQAFFTKMNNAMGVFADENGEPKFSIFKNNVFSSGSQFVRSKVSYVLTPENKAFIRDVNKKGNELQQKIVDILVENPINPLFLEEETHVYINENGEELQSITKAIYGEFTQDTTVYLEYGSSIDKLLQGVILGKKFDEIVKNIDNIDRAILKNAYNSFQVYIESLTRDGSIIITQVKVGDNESLRAGSLDLLVISPEGRLKIIDLKTSKNSIVNSDYSKPFQINNNGSVFKGESLSTRQKHGIQVGAYKKLLELMGFEVDEVATVHLKLSYDKNNKITDLDYEGEINHPITFNRNHVDRIIPTPIPQKNILNELREELGIDNPADDPDLLSEEDKRPEKERFGDMFEKMFLEVKEIISKFEVKRRYLDRIKTGKTRQDKDEMIDKITELIVLMGDQLQQDSPSQAYGFFLRHAIKEITDYLKDITDPKAINDTDFVSLLLEVDKYVESYRGMISVKNMGSKEQQKMLLQLLDLLDDTKEAIDERLEEYVKTVVKDNSNKDISEEELKSIMKEVYDIKSEDFYLGDIATSTDTLLATVNRIHKAAMSKVRDRTEATTSRIYELGNRLLKAFNVTKPDSKFYDFMKVFNDAGEFTGRYVTRVGQQYWEMYYRLKNQTKDKNGDTKQYIPIMDITKASEEDLKYNMDLFEAKKAFMNFYNAEILGPTGAEDGPYHKFSDNFKIIRARYQKLVSYEKEDGTLFFKWDKKDDITDEQYQQFFLKYFNKVDYWGVEFEKDGTFKGRVGLKSKYFVKQEFIEIRDIAADGTDLRDSKYVKLMNPKTPQEQAQSEFYKAWVQEYEAQLEKLPPEVAAKMRGKVGRVASSMIEKMKTKGEGFFNVVSKSFRQFFTADVYTNQRLVDELGQIDRGLPILYVGNLQNKSRIEYLKKELNELKYQRADKKITQKEYMEKKEKLKKYLKIEETRLKGSEIESDLVTNLITFAAMAENFDTMTEIENDLQAISKIMEKRTYYQTNSIGEKLIAKGSRQTKDDPGKPVVKRPEDVLATKRLNKWFQMVFYNNQEFNRSTLAMVAKRLQNFTSLKGMGFNLFGGINNYVMARINTAIESAGGLYYDGASANRAVKEYNTDYLPGVFKGLGKSKDSYYASKQPNSKYEALVSFFNIVRKYQDDSGKVDAMSWAYMFQEGGEYNAQSKSGIAVLMTKMIKNNKTGDEMSIYDAFDFDPNTGQLKLKDGFELPDKEKYELINYIFEVNKQIHGNYAWEDRMVIQEHWLGQLAAQFHKWLYPAYKVRFKARYEDANLGTVEGRYVTVMNLLKYIKESEGSFLEKMRTGWKSMDAVQVKNMYKNIAEIAFFAASFGMYGIFRSLSENLGGDDDDKVLRRWINFMAYQQSRQMNEISTLIPLVGSEEQYMLAKSPLAVLTTLKDFGQAIKETLMLPFPPYDKNYYEKGVHKGELKAWKEWKDVIPALTLLNRWDSYDTVKSFYVK